MLHILYTIQCVLYRRSKINKNTKTCFCVTAVIEKEILLISAVALPTILFLPPQVWVDLCYLKDGPREPDGPNYMNSSIDEWSSFAGAGKRPTHSAALTTNTLLQIVFLCGFLSAEGVNRHLYADTLAYQLYKAIRCQMCHSSPPMLWTLYTYFNKNSRSTY